MRVTASSLLVGAASALAACAGAITPAPPPPAASATSPASSTPPAPLGPRAPVTRRDDFHETLHGVDLVDPYRWLEDDASAETRAWIDAQSAYTRALLEPLSGRATVRARLEQLSRVDDQGTPIPRGGRVFVWQKRADDDLWTLHVRTKDHDEVLLDPHPLSADHTTDVTEEDIAKDGSLVVYGIRRGGEDETELHVRDVATRTDRPDVLPRALYRGASLRPDNAGFYYSLQDRATGIRVRYHALGKPVASDVEVFGEGFGPSDWVDASPSRNGRHVIFSVQHGWASNEVFVQDLPGGKITPVIRGLAAHFDATFADDHLVVRTDLDAPNGRVVEVDPRRPSPDKWRTIVPAGSDPIQDVAFVGKRLVVHTLHDVSSQLRIYALDGKPAGDVALPALGSVRAIQGEWDGEDLFVGFTNLTTPRTTLRTRIAGGGARPVETWWSTRVPFASDGFETKQIWCSSKDGTRVPMFVVAKKGLPLDGNRPTLLWGYGGFNFARLPMFSSSVAWFIEQGGVYALANIRGGSEFGEAWHKAGMLDKKQNVFDDFIAAAQKLIADGYTKPDRLGIRGGSNGGLLVGAALTQRPDLFRVVLADFPEMDVVGFYRFKNNNPAALLEYGDASKPDQLKFVLAYSPYQNVVQGTHYPAVFLVTGDEDTRVPALEARKMTARLQAATASGRPIALLYDTKSGHAGGRPLGKWLDDESQELTFLAWQLGMDVAGRGR
jgi:prolyl oligopeptidase